jgi:predicted DNA binding CopG/RHH family protein
MIQYIRKGIFADIDSRMHRRRSATARIPVAVLVLSVSALLTWGVSAQQPNPRQQPGAAVTMYAPEQHDLYDGHYILSANRIHMVGGLNDPVGWDHMDNDAKTVKPVAGTADSVERGEWKSGKGGKRERARYSRYAKATFRKDRRLNIRLSSKDLEAIQKRALAEGLPYQTLISSLLHKYASGRLKEV